MLNFPPDVVIELNAHKHVIDELLADRAIVLVEPAKKEKPKPRAERKGE